jgi:hypothetical protein
MAITPRDHDAERGDERQRVGGMGQGIRCVEPVEQEHDQPQDRGDEPEPRTRAGAHPGNRRDTHHREEGDERQDDGQEVHGERLRREDQEDDRDDGIRRADHGHREGPHHASRRSQG